MTDRRGTDLASGHPFLEGLSGLKAQSAANLALGGSWVDLVLDAYLELVFAADTKVTNRLVTDHDAAMRSVRPLMADALDELTDPFDADAMFASKKWQRLESEVSEVIGAYSPRAARAIEDGTASAIHLANQSMDQSWTAMALDMNNPKIAGKWATMPDRAFADMVGRLQDGSPLSDLLDGLPAATNKEMRRGLLRGIALGENADVVGRRVAAATGLPRYRAVSISRTTILNSYRETSRRGYASHPDLVDGWFWQSAQNTRTCMACLERDGTLYPLNEPMSAHPQCRCRLRPRLRNGENTIRETGHQWFMKQPPSVQAKMLGPATNRAWMQGKIDLADLAGFAVDPRWGASSRRRSLSEAISFAESGRPFDPRDFPPGWSTPLDKDVLELGAEQAFIRLAEARAIAAAAGAPPTGAEDFLSCMRS